MKTFSITDVGMVRQVNQDYVYMTDNPLGPLPNLFVVADGMGGHQADGTPWRDQAGGSKASPG